MSDRQRLTAELEETFGAELEDRLETMNAALLELEQGVPEPRRAELLRSLFRDAHSLKGGAQLVGQQDLAAVAHAAEAHLSGVVWTRVDSALDLERLFAAVETIGRLAQGSPMAPGEVQRIVASFDVDAVEAPARDGRSPSTDGPDPASEVAPSVPPELPAPAAEPDGPAAERPGALIRVSAERLDALLSRSGDLIAARDVAAHQERRIKGLAADLADRQQDWGQLGSAARRLGRALPDGALRRLLEDVGTMQPHLAEAEREARAVAGEARIAAQRFGQLVDQLEAELRDLRMVPVARLFRPFSRMVRDLGVTLDKPVSLHGVGWDTPIDRELLERLKDPVMHLLRNAVDHGIEPAEARRARGKPVTGSVTLEARREGDRVVIEVRDDGGGIDRERVLARAMANGSTRVEAGTDGDAALQTIFQAGFSTLDAASAVSGRGIGLDVVAGQVSSLGGTIAVRSDVTGTSFALRLPLTLISTRVLMIRVGQVRYALPVDAVQRVFHFAADEVDLHGGRQTIRRWGRLYVLADLSATLGLPAVPVSEGRPSLGLLTGPVAAPVAFVVTAVDGEREVVIRQLGQPVGRIPLIAGAALVEQDDVVLVLDPVALAASATGRSSARYEPASAAIERRDANRPLRVLVADDSITTRTLEKNILSAAGFDVALAADGREALRSLRLEPFDLLVSDVDMPGIDGFQLTERVRSNEATRDLPVILVTGKERPEDRERGMHAGANAYVLKSEFDHQALVNTIREVVG